MGILAGLKYKIPKILGRVALWWLNLQQYVWFLGKAEPMKCGYSP
ncbi:hypothetical protein PCARR_a2686 [Pseudoalteromonas carrageenovora IAM 12662]|uniref:Transposase n=1 Tax=Pseudoalteromonas carrageenovora IAM 12662 TaxID=1314868 RepID=A0ABR9EKB1_PSEVC|nr:hypothetical protein [Pseudoalteromonas carrageenovora IAM 12662]